MENIVSFLTNTWNRFVAVIMCIIATVSAWICPPVQPPEPEIAITALIEEIDLSLPESRQYVDWYEAMVAGRMASPYRWLPEDKEPQACDITWIDVPGQDFKLRNLRRDWDATTEIVVEHSNVTNRSADVKFFLRNKATGAIEMIAELKNWLFDFPITWFYVQSILDDRYLLYLEYTWDGWTYYLYDRKNKSRILVGGGEPVELNDTQLLYMEWDTPQTNMLKLIDARKFAAGDKNAKRTVVQFDRACVGSIAHVSHDKRFVHVNLYRWSDAAEFRGIYDIETGAQVAFFELPWWAPNMVLVNDGLEYVYWEDYNGGLEYFYVIRYERSE